MLLEIRLSKHKTIQSTFLVESELDLHFLVPGLDVALHNIETQGFLLLDPNLQSIDTDRVQGLRALFGVDIIQHLKDLNVVDCLYGSVFEFDQGIVPFGNINNFLEIDQVLQVVENSKCLKTNAPT